MLSLTPLARISAAIEKLERLKAESTPGVWEVPITGRPEALAWDGSTPVYSTLIEDERRLLNPADAELIVTLHRTIDAQIAVLAREKHSCRRFGDHRDATPNPDILALADSILGGES